MLFCLLSNIYKAFEKLLYTKVQIFHDKSNIVYSLQFGFRQHYSTSYALVNLTEETMKAPNDGDFGCDIFLTYRKLLISRVIAFCWVNYVITEYVYLQRIGLNHINQNLLFSNLKENL